ncbi:MAG: histidine phosphatase family protein, partial [Pseudomonadota bacterium]
TSGGVIGMMIARLLALRSDGFAQMMLPIRNTSIHRFGIETDVMYLDSYNLTPHLDMPDRVFAKTFV